MEADQRRPRKRAVQDDQRRRPLDEDLLQPRLRDGHAREDRRLRGAERSARRLRNRAGSRRRRLPLQRRRRNVEADERRDEAAPARLLLHGNLRRSDESAGRLRAGSQRYLQDQRRRQDVYQHRHAARRQPHHLDRSTAPDDAAGRQRRRRHHLRSTAAPTGAASAISRRGSSITLRSTISFRSTSSVHRRTRVRSKARAPQSARASAPATGTTLRSARARS